MAGREDARQAEAAASEIINAAVDRDSEGDTPAQEAARVLRDKAARKFFEELSEDESRAGAPTRPELPLRERVRRRVEQQRRGLTENLTVTAPTVEGCKAGPSEAWWVVDDGGMVAYRRFPRMDAKATTVRPAQRGELVQAVAEACNLPAGWVQTRSPDGAAAHHGLWLPRQFLMKVNRSYELAAHMARQSKLKDDTSRNKASEAAAGRARAAAGQRKSEFVRHFEAKQEDRGCVDDAAAQLKVGNCAANVLAPGCDTDLHTIYDGHLYGPEFAGVTVADICPRACGRCA